jgi:hypothetical protein
MLQFFSAPGHTTDASKDALPLHLLPPSTPHTRQAATPYSTSSCGLRHWACRPAAPKQGLPGPGGEQNAGRARTALYGLLESYAEYKVVLTGAGLRGVVGRTVLGQMATFPGRIIPSSSLVFGGNVVWPSGGAVSGAYMAQTGHFSWVQLQVDALLV